MKNAVSYMWDVTVLRHFIVTVLRHLCTYKRLRITYFDYIFFFRVKELGPEDGPSSKKFLREDDYMDENQLEQSKEKYRNAELAMLCTHSVSKNQSFS